MRGERAHPTVLTEKENMGLWKAARLFLGELGKAIRNTSGSHNSLKCVSPNRTCICEGLGPLRPHKKLFAITFPSPISSPHGFYKLHCSQQEVGVENYKSCTLGLVAVTVVVALPQLSLPPWSCTCPGAQPGTSPSFQRYSGSCKRK